MLRREAACFDYSGYLSASVYTSDGKSQSTTQGAICDTSACSLCMLLEQGVFQNKRRTVGMPELWDENR